MKKELKGVKEPDLPKNLLVRGASRLKMIVSEGRTGKVYKNILQNKLTSLKKTVHFFDQPMKGQILLAGGKNVIATFFVNYFSYQ